MTNQQGDFKIHPPVDPATEYGKFYLELQNVLSLYRRLRFPENVHDPITVDEKVFYEQMNGFMQKWGPKDE